MDYREIAENNDGFEVSIPDLRDLAILREWLMKTDLKGLLDDRFYLEPVGVDPNPCYIFDLYRGFNGSYRWTVETVNGYDYLPDDIDAEDEFLSDVENEPVLHLCFYTESAVAMAEEMLSLANEGQFKAMFA